MDDPNGWPDKPGVPLNPEQDGWHWVGYFDEQVPRARFWYAEDNGWGFGLPADEPERCRYYGPILYPAEVAARVAEARAKALEEAQQVARRVPIPCECSPAEAHGRMTGALAAADAIRALKEAPT